jgi:histone H3/H4
MSLIRKLIGSKPKKETHLTDPAIARLAYKAGSTRLEKNTYDVMRKFIEGKVGDIVRQTAIVTEGSGRKIAKGPDVQLAMQSLGMKVYFSSMFSSDLSGMNVCKVYQGRGGIKSKIRHYQNQKSCLVFPKLPFARIVQAAAERNVQFPKNVVTLIQLVVEAEAIQFLARAVLGTVHAKRKTLGRRDLEFARSVEQTRRI